MADDNNDYDAPTLDFSADADAPAEVVADAPEADGTSDASEDGAGSTAEPSPAEETPAEPSPAEDAPAEDAPAADAPAADAPAADAPAADAPAVDAPAAEASSEETAAEPAQEKPEAPQPLTAVSLGLLPEVFVSQVSTQLHFYAPEVLPLPARPGRERVFDRIAEREPEEPAGRRGRRRRGGSDDVEQREPREQRDEPRQPRQRVVEYITEPKAIKGSTRLEAKKQRRRDGRDAGRRRPVVTEAEFLARRESVSYTHLTLPTIYSV